MSRHGKSDGNRLAVVAEAYLGNITPGVFSHSPLLWWFLGLIATAAAITGIMQAVMGG